MGESSKRWKEIDKEIVSGGTDGVSLQMSPAVFTRFCCEIHLRNTKCTAVPHLSAVVTWYSKARWWYVGEQQQLKQGAENGFKP